MVIKENCLERLVALYDTVLEFVRDREVFQFLKSNDTSIDLLLSGVFGKLNGLNKELQGAQNTLMDSKTKICAFITTLTFWRSQIARRNIYQFPHLSQCEPSDEALRIITEHFAKLSQELNRRYTDLKSMTFPAWIPAVPVRLWKRGVFGHGP